MCVPSFDEQHCLTGLLEGDVTDRDDSNEPIIFQKSPYINNTEFVNLLKDKINNFKILSLNCQSLNAKYDQLKAYIEYFNESNCEIDAICLQETWLTADSDVSLLQLPNYNLISTGKSCSAHSGVAVYLHKAYQYNIVNIAITSEFWDCQLLEIYVSDKQVNKKIMLGNFYRPPRPTNEHIYNFINDLNQIFDKIKIYKYIVLAGDFNINLLKCKENSSINDFVDNILSNGFLPKITVPTRLTQRNGTLIDNFFVKISDDYSPTTARVLINNISDHLPYFISLDYIINSDRPKDKFIKISYSGPEAMEKFRKELTTPEMTHRFRNICQDNPNDSFDNFNSILSYYIDKHFPCKYVRFNRYKHKKTKWITHAILKSISFRDKLYVKLKSMSINNDQYDSSLTNFKSYNRILKHTIRNAKKLYYNNCFHRYKSDIKKTWSTINNIISKSKKMNDYPKEFLINGNFESNEKTIANEFNRYFIEIGPKLSQNIISPNNKSIGDYLKSPVQTNFQFKRIDIDTVIKAIDSLKPKTSFSQDRISNKLLKYIKYEIAWPLMELINYTFALGIFPNTLKIAKVTPLYKKNENYMFDNYRPVSVLSSVSKVYERIMHDQIYNHFNGLNLFYNSQYGFRSNHSTEYALLELTDRIITEMDNNNIPINIFMDLSKAFDTLDHKILLHKLNYYGFHDKSYDLLKCYLSNRFQYVVFNNVQSDLIEIKCGVPQGSILGPLLFIIYLNDMPNVTEYFTPIIYADDTTLFTTLNYNNVNDTQHNINDELQLISDWLKLNKLSLNASKTKAMLFHSPQRQISNPTIFIDDTEIDFVNEFNFLGIILDKNLKWRSHVTFISKKISKTIGILSKLKNTIPTNALLNIYNALILSYLNYGTIIWGWQSQNLFKLQKKAVRIIMKSKYNAHTNALFKQLNTLKIQDICALHDYKFCFKLINDLIPTYFSDNLSPRENIIHEHNTRYAHDLRLPAVRHEFARNGIRYKFPFMFNNMPEHFKDKIYTHSLFGIKFYFKRKTIETYDTVCRIPNCYICQN